MRFCEVNGRLVMFLGSFQPANGLRLPDAPPGFVPGTLLTTPSDFVNVRIDVPEVTLLKELHPHCRDKNLKFVSDTHTYFIDGIQTLGSVTGLVHRFADEFDADAVIDRMMCGQNWQHTCSRQHITRGDSSTTVIVSVR